MHNVEQYGMASQEDGELGIVMPVAGQIHQEYLRQLYQGLAPLRRGILTFGVHENGWVEHGEELTVLKNDSLCWKIANRMRRTILSTRDKLLCREQHAPLLPIEWKRCFREYMVSKKITGLVIFYGGCGVAMLGELEASAVPIAIVFCGSDAQIADQNPWYRERLQRLWQRADRCVFVSEFLKRQALERGCPSNKSEVLYLGCPVPEVMRAKPAGNTDIHVVCVANLHEVKGHAYLLDAFSEVRRSAGNIVLTLIGSGPLERELKKQIHKLGLADSVEMTGTLSSTDFQSKLARSDIYVQPSIRGSDGSEEGLPQATIEAMAAGLPVIVSQSGGLPEIVEEGQSGFVVPEGDSTSLATRIKHLCEDSELRRRMSAGAYARVHERFNAEKQHMLWREMVLNLIHNNVVNN